MHGDGGLAAEAANACDFDRPDGHVHRWTLDDVVDPLIGSTG